MKKKSGTVTAVDGLDGKNAEERTRCKKRIVRFQKAATLCLSRHDMAFRDPVRLVRPVRLARQSRKAVIP